MPARRAFAAGAVRPALQAQWHRLAGALAPLDPGAATGLAGCTVARLESHLAAGVHAVTRSLDPPAPARAELDLAAWAAAAPSGAPAPGPGAFGVAVREALAALDAAGAADRAVRTGRGALRLGDWLATRCLEAVVHGADLPEPVAPEPAALAVCVRALLEVLGRRHPGGSVELRVAPFGAAQLVAGPRHTRGTPPNVVEIEPLAFVELGCGRVSWTSLARSGRLRASGTRADLSALLPAWDGDQCPPGPVPAG